MAFDLFIENASLLGSGLDHRLPDRNISPAILISRAAGSTFEQRAVAMQARPTCCGSWEKAALITLVIDVFKGVIAVVIGRAWWRRTGSALWIVCICRHIGRLYLNFVAEKESRPA